MPAANQKKWGVPAACGYLLTGFVCVCVCECECVCSSFLKQVFVPLWIHARLLCASNYRRCISNMFSWRKKKTQKLRLVSFICKQDWHLGEFLFTQGVMSSDRRQTAAELNYRLPYRQAQQCGSIWITRWRRQTACLPTCYRTFLSF